MRFRIELNGGVEDSGQTYFFEYCFWKSVKIKLGISSQKASIKYEYDTESSPDEQIDQIKRMNSTNNRVVSSFRDAMRKVYIIHPMIFNVGIDVKTVMINAGGKVCLYDNRTPNFPFVVTHLQLRYLNIPSIWFNRIINPRSEFRNGILIKSTSDQRKDYRFSAIFSYLLGQSETNAVERFNYLWTSMNALYCFTYDKFIKDISSLVVEISEENNLKSDKVLKSIKLGDEKLVGMMAWLTKDEYHKKRLPGPDSGENEDYEKKISRISTCIMKLLNPDGNMETMDIGCLYRLKSLYDDSKLALEMDIDSDEYTKYKEKYSDLLGTVDDLGDYKLPLYTLIIFDMAYNWRCNYVHGRQSSIFAAAYNDWELYNLYVINFFLSNYLGETLVELFDADYWNGEKSDKVMQYIYCCDAYDNKIYKEFLKKVTFEDDESGEDYINRVSAN